ncbi:MAG: GGDEF domain-containing protein [Anaerolineales bacterium]
MNLQFLVALMGPISSTMSVVVLLLMPAAVGLGIIYRQKWLEQSTSFGAPGFKYGDGDLRQARGTEWVCETLDTLLRWSYYTIGGAVIANIVISALTPGTVGLAIPPWLALFALQSIAVVILMAAYSIRDDDEEMGRKSTLLAADESFASRHGMRIRDKLTGLCTTEYWIHRLELRLRRVIFKGKPVTCLVLQIGGLKELRERQGDEAANHVLVRAASMLEANVRSGTLICRFESASFAVALFRCPKKRGLTIGQNLAANIQFEVLDSVQEQHGVELELSWASAIMPGDASTPVQLLRAADWKLKRQRRASTLPSAQQVLRDPEAENGNPPAAA